ncbi:hypothetical protein CUC08_Gglean005052 [Alternaria sp. MG1]|nr:hypothetical protein CUC08_Gglean005052 [Alternaria sp. MG1]
MLGHDVDVGEVSKRRVVGNHAPHPNRRFDIIRDGVETEGETVIKHRRQRCKRERFCPEHCVCSESFLDEKVRKERSIGGYEVRSRVDRARPFKFFVFHLVLRFVMRYVSLRV